MNKLSRGFLVDGKAIVVSINDVSKDQDTSPK